MRFEVSPATPENLTLGPAPQLLNSTFFQLIRQTYCYASLNLKAWPDKTVTQASPPAFSSQAQVNLIGASAFQALHGVQADKLMAPITAQ